MSFKLEYDESIRPPPDTCLALFHGTQVIIKFYREGKIQQERGEQIFKVEDSIEKRSLFLDELCQQLTLLGFAPNRQNPKEQGPYYIAFQLIKET